MSHFSVMVIGEGVEAQLAPYDENLRVKIDVTDKLTAKAQERTKYISWNDGDRPYYGKKEVGAFATFRKAGCYEQKKVKEATFLEIFGSLEGIAEDEGYYKEGDRFYSSYNPNAKWDWWVVGGRWRNALVHVDNPRFPEKLSRGDLSVLEYLDLKEGKQPAQPANHCDSAAICDIDWETMAEENRVRAVSRWEEFMRINPELKPGMSRKDLDAFCDAGGKINDTMYLWGAEKVPTKQEIENKAYSLTTYALVKNGEWYEKGEMGWFGLSSNEKSCAEWQELFEKLLDGLPEDTRITIVDCHI